MTGGGDERSALAGTGRIALGTDGIGGDMITESQAAFFRAREASLAAPPSWPLDRLAASSRAAGRVFGEPLLGRIVAGAPADITVLDYPAPTPVSAGNLAGHWIFGLSPRQVRDVLVAGELVVADRRSTRVDTARLAAEAAIAGEPAVGAARRHSAARLHALGRRSRMTSASPSRVALYLQDKHPIRDGMHYAQYAESRGFEAVWQAESRLVREATVPMAAYAAVTSRIKIGSGVIPIWTRNVGLLAATFSTLSELAPGRIMMGLGAWWEPLASKVGVDRRRPLTAMREVVEAARQLLALQRVSYHGEFVHLDDVEIDIVHGDRSPRDVPIYVGATGMKMMELAGEIGDGVLLNYMVSPDYNRRALDALATGAARAGRTIAEVDRPQLVVCSVDNDRDVALDRSRELLTQYLGQQPHIMKASGVDPALIAEIGKILTWPASTADIRRAMKLVPDEAVQMISASGTPEECKAKVAEYIAAGATCPILYPLGDDVELMIDTFAQGPGRGEVHEETGEHPVGAR